MKPNQATVLYLYFLMYFEKLDIKLSFYYSSSKGLTIWLQFWSFISKNHADINNLGAQEPQLRLFYFLC